MLKFQQNILILDSIISLQSSHFRWNDNTTVQHIT